MANNLICGVDGCSNPARKAGMCFAHYERKRRYGAPEMGGPMQAPKGEPAAYLRNVVLKYEGKDCLYWPFARGGGGRGQIKQGGRVRSVHRIVCEDVNGPSPSEDHEAAHTCGMGHNGCVSPSHLVWKTRVENQADRISHGTDIRGEKNVRAKLTMDNVLDIRANELDLSKRELAIKYGVSQRCIYSVLVGSTWRSV